MKSWFYACLAFLFLSLFCIPFAHGQSLHLDGRTYMQKDGAWYLQEGANSYWVNEKELTVRFASQPTDKEIQQIFKARGLEEIRHNRLGFYDLKITGKALSFEMAHALASDPVFETAFASTYGEYYTNDPSFPSQWNMHNTGSGGGTVDADIDAPEAWAIATGDPSIIVAPLDSGIDYHHNDLGPNIWQNLGEDADHDGQTLVYSGGQWVFDPGDINNIDDDGNGMKDDLIGWDPENNNNDVFDNMGHGTHVSGIVAARSNNSTNVAGVAGGWGSERGVSIMMVQVGDWAPAANILDDAIIYAVDNGARVITMSLGVGEDPAIDAAVDYAVFQGVFVNCSAGNTYGGGVTYPATLNSVVAVSATTRNDTFASFSAMGPEVLISAPGDDVTSTTVGQSQGSMSGTSMSSPHIAGAAGLVLSVAPWMTRDEVLYTLTSTADDLGAAGWDKYFGHGRLNLFEAVKFASGMEMLHPNTFTVDAVAGGTIKYTLEAGSAYANRPYLLLATLSGTSPGTSIGTTTLPLNWDAVTDLGLILVNTAYLPNAMGNLDAAGGALASFKPAPNDLRSAVGMTLHFAYMLGSPLDTASNAVPLFIE
ncbi:MAG: S8 family serine peptidase [Planctomycetota bacterium]